MKYDQASRSIHISKICIIDFNLLLLRFLSVSCRNDDQYRVITVWGGPVTHTGYGRLDVLGYTPCGSSLNSESRVGNGSMCYILKSTNVSIYQITGMKLFILFDTFFRKCISYSNTLINYQITGKNICSKFISYANTGSTLIKVLLYHIPKGKQ
jgi:hypothetical protein